MDVSCFHAGTKQKKGLGTFLRQNYLLLALLNVKSVCQILPYKKIVFTFRLTFESYDHVLRFPNNFYFLTIIMLLFYVLFLVNSVAKNKGPLQKKI